MKFFIGANHPHWLWKQEISYPLFVSVRPLLRYKKFKPSQNDWALDSGGFTELNMFGKWETKPKQYIESIIRFNNEIGRLQWASPQDWMCEPSVIQKTKLSVRKHQELTVDNLIELRSINPDLNIIPVLQGWEPQDYYNHIEMYSARGIDLVSEKQIGVGTLCRRASFKGVHNLIVDICQMGMKVHCYGVKSDGMPLFGSLITSADSMAWSYGARWANKNLCGEEHRAPRCSQCIKWATIWADNVTAKVGFVEPKKGIFLG